MSARDVALLEDSFRIPYAEAVRILSERGIDMRPYCTIRTPWEQAIAWRQSRSTARIVDRIRMLRDLGAPWLADVLESVGPHNGPPITGALPGESWHQWGLAADWYWHYEGDAIWDADDFRMVEGRRVNGYREAFNVLLELGLTTISYRASGGRIITDWPHAQGPKEGGPQNTWPDIDQVMRKRFEKGATCVS
jgi:peptidoglycan LD-endopeptidase CwlK